MNNDITSRSSLKDYARTVLSEDSPTNIALLKMFDEIIDNAPDCWIPVSERLPDKDGSYLCTVRYKDDKAINVEKRFFDKYENGDNWNVSYRADEILAWQPLPESYKEV